MKRLAALIFWFALVYSAHAQSIQQSGTVTPTHLGAWTTSGVLQDAGTAAQPFASTGGVSPGPWCVNSGPVTGPYQAFCMNVSPTGAVISIQNFGGASAGGISFNVNGTPSNFATVPASTTNGDLACYIGTSGQLGDCGTIAASLLPAGVSTNTLNAQSSNYSIATSDCGKTIYLATPITLTLPVVAGFASNCVVNYANVSTTRGIVMSGFPAPQNNILWPQQAGEVGIENGAWVILINPGRWKVTSPTFQVDQANGSDTNNDCLGTTTGACQSISGAFALANPNVDTGGHTITIQLAANQTYTTNLPFTFTFCNTLYALNGSLGVLLGAGIAVKDYCAVAFNNLGSTGFNGIMISVDQNGILDVNSTVTCGNGSAAPSLTCIDVENGGVANVHTGYTINASSLNNIFQTRSAGRIIFDNPSTINIPTAITIGGSTLFADNNSFMNAVNLTFSGSGVAGSTGTRCSIARGAGVWTAGSYTTASYILGSGAACSATSPGWVQ